MRLGAMLLATVAATIGLAAVAAGTAVATPLLGEAHGIQYMRGPMIVFSAGRFGNSAECLTAHEPLSGGVYTARDLTGFRMLGSFRYNTESWVSRVWSPGGATTIYTLELCRPDAAVIDPVSKSFAVRAGTPSDPTVVSASAKCPSNQRVVSGGVDIGYKPGAFVAGSYPVATFNVWRTTVVNRGAPRRATVQAVCVPTGSGLTYAHETQTFGTDAGAFNVTIACPAGGVPIGGGARWQGMQRQVAISTSSPVDGSGGVDSIPDAAWSVGTSNVAGSPKDLTIFVICKPG